MKLRGLSVYSGTARPLHPCHADLRQRSRRSPHARSAATTCAPPCSGPAMAWCPTPRWSWAWRARAWHPMRLLITGMAGLLAGALSMGAGEYVSVRSQREFYEYQIALEREELAEYPEAEVEELALIYNARGLDIEEARQREPQAAVESRAGARGAGARGAGPQSGRPGLARRRGGLLRSAASPWAPPSRCCPSCSGLRGNEAIYSAAGDHGLRLFGLGVALSLFTGHGALRGGLRQMLIGGGAGAGRLDHRQAARRERGADARRGHRRASGQRQDHADRAADPGPEKARAQRLDHQAHPSPPDRARYAGQGQPSSSRRGRLRGHRGLGFRLGAHRRLRRNRPACRSCWGSCGRWTWCWSRDSSNSNGCGVSKCSVATGEPLALADPGIAAVAVPAGVALAGYHGDEVAAG